MSPEIVVMGMAAIDHLYLMADITQLPGGRVLDYSIQGGGPAATAAAAASVLGGSVGMITCLGDDERGRLILSGLQECGVDTSRSVVKPGAASPMVLVFVDGRSGERYFAVLRTVYPPGRAPLGLSSEDIDWDYVAGARILHADNWLGDNTEAFRRARAMGLTITMDTSLKAAAAADWVALVDVLIAGADSPDWRDEPERALQAASEIAARGPRTVILTLGEAGCVGVAPEGSFRLPAHKVNVVDTTGTGDVFHGTYAYGLTQGWSALDCARFASAAAALSATALGGRGSLPTRARVVELLRSSGETGPWDASEKNVAAAGN